MSRIGKMPIAIPAGVSIDIDEAIITVTGPKGTLTHTVASPITVEMKDGVIEVSRPDDERVSKSLHGLTRTLISNMVVGVTEGYEKKLEIIGVGYRVTLKSPTELEFALGFSHPVVVKAVEGITFAVDNQTHFSVFGISKQVVGETAANIRKIRKPEPYKGKGVRYVGEQVRRKAGKAGK